MCRTLISRQPTPLHPISMPKMVSFFVCAKARGTTWTDWRPCSLSFDQKLHKFYIMSVGISLKGKSYRQRKVHTLNKRNLRLFGFVYSSIAHCSPLSRMYEVNGTCCSRRTVNRACFLIGGGVGVWAERWFAANDKHRWGKRNNGNKIKNEKKKHKNLIKNKLFYWKWVSLGQPSSAACANYKWSNKWCGELM